MALSSTESKELTFFIARYSLCWPYTCLHDFYHALRRWRQFKFRPNALDVLCFLAGILGIAIPIEAINLWWSFGWSIWWLVAVGMVYLVVGVVALLIEIMD